MHVHSWLRLAALGLFAGCASFGTDPQVTQGLDQYRLGRYDAAVGPLTDAARALASTRPAGPRLPEIYIALGDMAQRSRKPDLADDYFGRAVKAAGSVAVPDENVLRNALNYRGVLCLARNRPKEAQALLEQAAAISGSNRSLPRTLHAVDLEYLAQAHAAQGRFDEAVALRTRAVAVLDAASIEAESATARRVVLGNNASLLRKLGREDEAKFLEFHARTRGEASPAGGVAVYLIPLDDFPFEQATRLSRELAADLRLNVKAALPVPTAGVQPAKETRQYPARDLLGSMSPALLELPGRNEKSVFIALTTRDINDRSRQLAFLFAYHDRASRASVVSTARMADAGSPPDRLFLRAYKMVKRTVGEQYLGLNRSADTRDLMYAPIRSLEDLDALGTEFARKTR